MNKEYIIKIYMVNGEKDEWRDGEWDDYKLAGDLFVVINNGNWLGFYPIKSVRKIIVKKDN